jgi:hypothetical protein
LRRVSIERRSRRLAASTLFIYGENGGDEARIYVAVSDGSEMIESGFDADEYIGQYGGSLHLT